jgi:hypothetical protein
LRGPSPEQFAGLRVIGFQSHPGCVEAGTVRGTREMIWTGRTLGAGANSGFQAVNFAARCGARRVVLTGFDLSLGDGVHWHGRHEAPGLNNPDARMLAGCAKLLDMAAPVLVERGVEIVNASRKTTLTAWPRMTMAEALE